MVGFRLKAEATIHGCKTALSLKRFEVGGSQGTLMGCRAASRDGRRLVRCTAARNLCNLSLRTASGPEGSSAKQITDMCRRLLRVAVERIGRGFS